MPAGSPGPTSTALSASAIPAVSHRDVLQHMESSGVDLLQLWRGIGESLRERQRAAVTEAGYQVADA